MSTTPTSVTVNGYSSGKSVTDKININLSIRNYSTEEEKRNGGNRKQEVSNNFTIGVCQNFKIRICKPLIPLKLALFVWYGAASSFSTFLIVFLKQRGITLTELSTLHAITPSVQFLGPTICGIIADKIGRSKPVLVVNLLLTVLILIGMLLAPDMLVEDCYGQPANLMCGHQHLNQEILEISCNLATNHIHLDSCNVSCPIKVIQYCQGENLICKLLEEQEDIHQILLSVNTTWKNKSGNGCYYSIDSISHKNLTYSGCEIPQETYCNVSCSTIPEAGCSIGNKNRTKSLLINLVLLILYFTVFSNTYRFMDITAMALVKNHNSDFGRERFFGISGILIVTPFTGYLVDVTTIEGSGKNYNSAFYCFIALIFILLAIIYKLKVEIRPPGKNMWKKSLYLLKSPDVISFIFVLMIIGIAWGIVKNFVFWYLEEMDPPSILLGLINSAGALYGLPFLFTSNWWVQKIGTRQIFLLALIGYVVSGIGYSLIYNPWLSLLIEATGIVTYHLLWVAVIIHSHSLAPEGLTATVISTAGGIHYSFGKGSGVFIGGLIMNEFGARMTYRVMAMICSVSALLYAIYLYARKTCCTRNGTLDIKRANVNAVRETEEFYVKKISFCSNMRQLQ